MDNIRVIRLRYGLESKYYDEVIGQRALVDIEKGNSTKNGDDWSFN